jgi:hypothetical protein
MDQATETSEKWQSTRAFHGDESKLEKEAVVEEAPLVVKVSENV